MKCLVFCHKTNSVSKKMATFDDYKYYGYSQDLGLKVCPFNRAHKVKESKYHKHVLKCEQQYPTQHSVSSLKIDKRRLSLLIDDDLSSLKSFGNKSTNSGDSKSIASMRTIDDDHWERIAVLEAEKSSPRIQVDDESCLGSNASNDKTNSEAEDLVESITQKLNEIRVDAVIEIPGKCDVTDSGFDESDINGMKKIVNEDKTENSCQSNSEKTEESVANEKPEEDDWNCGAKEFVLIPEKADQLTDDDIMQMADTFIDPLIVAKMSKKEKKVFNEKLVKVTKQKSEQKLKALNDLMKYSDDCDTELKTIPDTIRMPRLDIKVMIKHYKAMNKKGLVQNKTSDQSQCSKTSESVNLVPSAQSVAPVLQQIDLETKELMNSCFSVICGGCKDSIDLKTCEIKKLIVYCQKCCGFKFGGYFECIPCNLYGYFAKKQIEDHMFIHYPQKVTVMDVNDQLVAKSVMN